MFRQLGIILFFLFPWIVGCQPPNPKDAPFKKGTALGTNKNSKLEEASGLAASAINPGYVWTHNDSGNPAEIFLLDSLANTKNVFTLKNVKNRDWEDIALGPCGPSNTPCLYIGDIGDNLSRYDYKYIYRFKEPALNDPNEITRFDTLIVKLPDEIRDSEALMADPVSQNLYLVTKREKEVILYEIANPNQTDTIVAKKICTLPYKYIVAGNISVNGSEVLLKSYEHIFYWKKKGNESLIELLQTPATKLPYIQEPQGEAIAWARDGSGFYTLSENAKGVRGKLYFYKRR